MNRYACAYTAVWLLARASAADSVYGSTRDLGSGVQNTTKKKQSHQMYGESHQMYGETLDVTAASCGGIILPTGARSRQNMDWTVERCLRENGAYKGEEVEA